MLVTANVIVLCVAFVLFCMLVDRVTEALESRRPRLTASRPSPDTLVPPIPRPTGDLLADAFAMQEWHILNGDEDTTPELRRAVYLLSLEPGERTREELALQIVMAFAVPPAVVGTAA